MSPRWLSRLAFSFLIVGSFLAWEGYQSVQGQRGAVGSGRIMLYFFAAMLCYVMGITGMRQRHRPQDLDDDTRHDQPPDDPPANP